MTSSFDMGMTPYSDFYSKLSKALVSTSYPQKHSASEPGSSDEVAASGNSVPCDPNLLKKSLENVKVDFVNQSLWEDLEAMGNELLVAESTL